MGYNEVGKDERSKDQMTMEDTKAKEQVERTLRK